MRSSAPAKCSGKGALIFSTSATGDARLQRLGAGAFDGGRSMIEPSRYPLAPHFNELAISVGAPLQLDADLGRGGRWSPVLERRPIAPCRQVYAGRMNLPAMGRASSSAPTGTPGIGLTDHPVFRGRAGKARRRRRRFGLGLDISDGVVQMASSSRSPVLIRTTWSIVYTNILPSPCVPVCAISITVLMTFST